MLIEGGEEMFFHLSCFIEVLLYITLGELYFVF